MLMKNSMSAYLLYFKKQRLLLCQSITFRFQRKHFFKYRYRQSSFNGNQALRHARKIAFSFAIFIVFQQEGRASICFYSISFLHWKSFSQLGDLIKQMPFLASPCCQNSFSHKSWTPNHSWEVVCNIFSEALFHQFGRGGSFINFPLQL